MKSRSWAFLVGLLALSPATEVSAQQQFVYHEELGPTQLFRRPSSCSDAGSTQLPYQVTRFEVDTSGSYAITSNQSFDGVILLYQDAFDPLAPLARCIAFNDDDVNSVERSFISSVELEAGTPYFLVTTASSGVVSGRFYNNVTGPGAITSPSTLTFQPSFDLLDNRFMRADATCTTIFPITVAYRADAFHVTVTGEYSIQSVQDHDGFLHVYDDRFNPTDPLLGCLAGNDDGDGGIGTSQIDAVQLVAGRTYYLVSSGFDGFDDGMATTTIDGPGGIFQWPGHITLSALSGLWYDPALEGAGFNIMTSDIGLIFTFYGYIDGRQRWLISDLVSNDIQVGQAITTNLQIGDGGQLGSPTSGANLPSFGHLEATFTSCTEATVQVVGSGDFASQQQTFNLVRLLHATGRDCAF